MFTRHTYAVKSHGLLLLAAAGLLLFTGTVEKTSAQELAVRFEEQLVIGDRENAPDEYLFGGPGFIRTDSEYRIYVATSGMEVRVFRPDGTYLTTLGRRGKGPGEFLDITAMEIGPKDEVLVYDGRSRRLTRFHGLGDSLETLSLPNPDWTGSEIIAMGGGRFASYEIRSQSQYEYLSKYVNDLKRVDYEGQAVHLLEGKSWDRIDSYFDVYEYTGFDREHPLEEKFATGSYQMASLNDSTLALTNEISRGSLFFMSINSGEVREVKGAFHGRENYEELDWDRRRDYPSERTGIVSSSGPPGYGPTVYQRKLLAAELVSNGRWVINFLRVAGSGSHAYHMEIFDSGGTYLGYTSLDNRFKLWEKLYSDFLGDEVLALRFYPRHLDDKDRLYYVDYSSGIPVIRVTKIILEQ